MYSERNMQLIIPLSSYVCVCFSKIANQHHFAQILAKLTDKIEWSTFVRGVAVVFPSPKSINVC